jgi:hypothetical protein
MASLNAGPEYYVAEKRYALARTPEEKIAALEEMLRYCPKHKGAEDILKDIKTKLARFKKELVREKAKKKAAKASRAAEAIRKQGPQVVLLGFANSGKTALFNALTGLRLPSSETPFETTVAKPGIMAYNQVAVQIVDTPSITSENRGMVFGLARNADLALVVLDATAIREQKRFFEENFSPGGAKVLYAISKAGLHPNVKKDSEHLTYDAFDERSMDEVKWHVYGELGIVRVFTKDPRGEVDLSKPIVLKRGATVEDAAEKISKELARNLAYAKIWGSSKFPGQQMGRSHVLKDGDVVEIHVK